MTQEVCAGQPRNRVDIPGLTIKSSTGSDNRSRSEVIGILEAEERRAMRQVQVVVIRELVAQLFHLGCQGPLGAATAARRPACHIRQITMYLCRVVLSMPYQHIADAISRDRSTVIHGCAVIEDRRDGADYDAFIDRCEKCVRAVFGKADEGNHVARG